MMDSEAAKELARKQLTSRIEARMRLKHKNNSTWARRVLKRGLDVADQYTRQAYREQHKKHVMLTRKMNSVNENSSSDDHDSDDMSAASDDDSMSKVLLKAKKMTRKVVEADEELPSSGVLSLPFMVRSLKKRRDVADQEANAAIKEYDLALKELEGDNVNESNGASSGRIAFGAPEKSVKGPSKKVAKPDNYFGNSDSESDEERKEAEDLEVNVNNKSSKKKYGGVKMNESGSIHDSKVTVRPQKHDRDLEADDEGDMYNGGEMVDGILSAGAKSSYEIPTHEEVIRRAFAGDDVEEAFEKDKEAVLHEENPEPEKPKLVLGWGQWTNVQKRKGLPSSMLKEYETAKQKREESLQKRKDSHLHKVIISEKLDKKAEKLYTKTLPFPYTSKDMVEQIMRMPIGPEFNPATAVGALTRPEVVKKSGLIIKPIQYEDMNIHERAEANKQNGGQKRKNGKDKNRFTKKNKPAKV